MGLLTADGFVCSFLGNKALCGKKIGIACGSYDEPTNGEHVKNLKYNPRLAVSYGYLYKIYTGLKIKHLIIGLGLAGAITVIALFSWIWRYTNYRSEKFGSKGVGKPLQGDITYKYRCT